MEYNENTLIKDRYRIISKLGMGGMGVVYLAEDIAVDRKVAVKINLDKGTEAKKQFEKEAKLLAGLRHPNLPLVTDHFSLEGAQYLVMDYIPGDTLSSLIKTRGMQTIEDAKKLAEQLGDALDYLHSQNPPIIHRDIKPSNIKIMPNGKVFLVDFGIAKISGGTLTATGAQGYTPGFAPPEQYSSARTGPFSDQYSLAATLYTMLTTVSPTEAIERMFGEKTLIDPTIKNKKIPKYMESALKRAMEIIPENRFQNILDFTKSFTNSKFVAHNPFPQTIKTTKKKGWKFLFVAIGFVVIGVFGIWYSPNSKSLIPAEPDSPMIVPSKQLIATQLPPTNTLVPTTTNTPMPSETLSPTTIPTMIPTPQGAGGLIAFVSNRENTSVFQIYTMQSDGSNLQQLTFGGVSKSQPAWSPDGKTLLFVTAGGGNLGLDIWKIDVSGENPTNLTHSVGNDTDPAWHPDGEIIAFVTTRVNDAKQIFFMNQDGSNPQFISRGFAIEYSPTWSLDGNWLAFSVSFNGAPPQLWLRDANGENPKPFDVSSNLGEVIHPNFSPDGKYIAYVDVKPSRQEIYLAVFEEKGFDLFQLTNSLGNKNPSWSPDSQWIIFGSTRDLNSEIYIMDSGGRFQINLTNNDANDKQPSWQPLP
jgi:eukaryotic-like serine/threonine-protein kinase